MWRGLFIASFLGTVLLAGCNTSNEALRNETPMQEIRNGVNDVIDNNKVRENPVNPTPTNPVTPTVPGNGVNEGTTNERLNENNRLNEGTTNGRVNETTTEKFTTPNGTVEESTTIDKNRNRVVE